MSAAVIGLIGVAVGALVTGFVSFLLERRREGREARRSRRLVSGEVSELGGHLDLLVRGRVVPPSIPLLELLPAEEWTAQKGVLAAALEDTPWNGVQSLYARVEQLRLGLVARGTGNPLRPDELKEAVDLNELAVRVGRDLGR